MEIHHQLHHVAVLFSLVLNQSSVIFFLQIQIQELYLHLHCWETDNFCAAPFLFQALITGN